MEILRHARRILANRKLALRFLQTTVTRGYLPLVVDINVTKHCNMRCAHCYAKLDTVQAVPEPTTRELTGLIDEAYALGVRWIRLLGGEPLLRKDLAALIAHVKGLGMLCEITTNGILVPERLEMLKDVDTICVSIDGGREEHDRLRGEGTWERVMAGIDAAAAAGLSPRLHCVLVGYTKHSIDAMSRIAGRHGLRFNFGECSFLDYPDPNFVLSWDEGNDFYRRYLAAKAAGAPISNSAECIRKMLEWPVKEHVITYDMVRERPDIEALVPECQFGYKYGFIDVDGHFYPCPRRWKHGVNYKDVGFEAAWKNMYESRPCYACKEMGCVERALIFGGHLGAIIKAYFGFS